MLPNDPPRNPSGGRCQVPKRAKGVQAVKVNEAGSKGGFYQEINGEVWVGKSKFVEYKIFEV